MPKVDCTRYVGPPCPSPSPSPYLSALVLNSPPFSVNAVGGLAWSVSAACELILSYSIVKWGPLDGPAQSAKSIIPKSLAPSLNLGDERKWRDYYERLCESRAVDHVAFATGMEDSVFGGSNFQPTVPPDHRLNILKWMSEACQAANWTTASFFTAAHAVDSYVTKIRHRLVVQDLAPLSAACLYLGAQMRESALETNVLTLSKFRRLCPDVSTHTNSHTHSSYSNSHTALHFLVWRVLGRIWVNLASNGDVCIVCSNDCRLDQRRISEISKHILWK